MDEEPEDFPPGCSCCLGCLVVPVMFFFIAFILMWFIPLPG
jgi:hypothetical protein